MDDKLRHWAWFLGPKAENYTIFSNLVEGVLQDYIHWRRNYFPGDPVAIPRSMVRAFEDEHDALFQRTTELTALLRRNFPFYSPRYMAHMLSDVLMPGMVGYFAGMLHNPNNVTPEAAPVTVDLEIEACCEVLKMLGFTPPPPVPDLELPPEKIRDYYSKHTEGEFGWAHIASGGTSANIEALWVARTVKYAPLAIADVCRDLDLQLTAKLPSGGPFRLSDASKNKAGRKCLLSLKPNESIYLLARFVEEVRRYQGLPKDQVDRASKQAFELMRGQESDLSHGVQRVFSDFPPVIFVSATAHYSIAKSADLLGIGRGAIRVVDVDSSFRMSIDDLREKLQRAWKKGEVPLAVIATVGTTEEGAVDPLHEVVDLRTSLETRERDPFSFWLHADAAWGGYVRSLFCLGESGEQITALSKVGADIGIKFEGDADKWVESILSRAHARVETYLENAQNSLSEAIEGALAEARNAGAQREELLPIARLVRSHISQLVGIRVGAIEEDDRALDKFLGRLVGEFGPDHAQWGNAIKEIALPALRTRLTRRLQTRIRGLTSAAEAGSPDVLMRSLEKFLHAYGEDFFDLPVRKSYKLTLKDRIQVVEDYVQSDVLLQHKDQVRNVNVRWASRSVCSALLAFDRADSITVDPHKLGYVPYPCGLIAFRNDRVRHFIHQDAPYITSARRDTILHLPPKHAYPADDQSAARISVASFGPFILEGSRPGAAATSLWLATKCLPLTIHGYGGVIRDSLLAARSLYEWLVHWDALCESTDVDTDYEFIPLTDAPPDLNVVTFVVRKKTSSSLRVLNDITKSVYDAFSIQTELGEREYSYGQPFFLSNTRLTSDGYNVSALESLFRRCKLPHDRAVRSFLHEGMVVLRATVMSPYIHGLREVGAQDLIRDYMMELAHSARKALLHAKDSG